VKLRYPGIRKAILNDLRLLGWAMNRALEVPKGAEFEGHRRAILDNLEAELDYRREAANQTRFRAALAELSAPRLSNWIVPEVIQSLSTDRVLVTAWEEGERIDQAAQWPQAEKHALAQQLAIGLVSLLLRKGVAQGDPHPGNYRFVRAGELPRIVVYDFGCLISLDEPQRKALGGTFRAFVEGGDPYEALGELGFRPEILDKYRPALPMFCGALFQPLWHSQAGLFDWNQLGGDGSATRQSGPLTLLMHIPPHLLFVLRAFRGLHAYAQRLGASIDWKAIQATLDGRPVARDLPP